MGWTSCGVPMKCLSSRAAAAPWPAVCWSSKDLATRLPELPWAPAPATKKPSTSLPCPSLQVNPSRNRGTRLFSGSCSILDCSSEVPRPKICQSIFVGSCMAANHEHCGAMLLTPFSVTLCYLGSRANHQVMQIIPCSYWGGCLSCIELQSLLWPQYVVLCQAAETFMLCAEVAAECNSIAPQPSGFAVMTATALCSQK